MPKTIFLLGLLGVLFSCSAQKQQAPVNDLAGFIQQKGDSLLKAENLPGLFVGVLDKGLRHYFSFGYAIPAQKTPFDSATLFEAGSITKTFTAYVLESVLQEKGIPDSNSIISYLPDSVQDNKALASVTFLSLLNHTSGLPRLPGNMQVSNESRGPYDNYTAADLFSYLKVVTPSPDGRSHYSNLGMGLAGHLAERIAGRDYQALLQQYVLVPFGIKKEGSPATPRQSVGYFMGQPTPYWNMNVLAPAGGLKATPEEMLSYLGFMSKPRSAQPARMIDHILQPTATLAPTMRIAKAWHTLEQENKPAIYWHNGGTYGFSTFAAFIRGTEQAVIVVVNQFNANKISDGLGMTIMKKMLD